MPLLPPSLSALVAASAAGLVMATRSIVGTKSARARSLAALLAREDHITVHGCLSQRLRAGTKVRCILSIDPASANRNGRVVFARVECDGIIVGLQPTFRRYGYQDVSLIVSKSDVPSKPVASWHVEGIR
jgi:hypothetical protein